MKLDNHKAIQELQINRIFRFLALIIVPFLLVNLSRYYYLGWTYLLYYDILAAVIILTISINSTKLAYYFKASFLMLRDNAIS